MLLFAFIQGLRVVHIYIVFLSLLLWASEEHQDPGIRHHFSRL